MRSFVLLSVLAAPAALAQPVPDTLRNLPGGTPLTATRSTTRWGYITGHNYRGTEEYAEKYAVRGSVRVLGVVAHLTGTVRHGTHVSEFNVYSVGPNRLPNLLLGGRQVFYRDLDRSGGPMTVLFAQPVAVADSFFVSFNVSDYSHGGFEGDTLAVLHGPSGSRAEADRGRFGRNAVRLHNHSIRDWADLYTQNFTPIATHLALFPIVELANPTAGEAAPVLASADLALHPAFPNPARDAVRLSFTLERPVDAVRVEVYDASGRRVREVALGARGAGRHEAPLDLDGLSSGLYIYAVAAGTSTLFSTLTLAR